MPRPMQDQLPCWAYWEGPQPAIFGLCMDTIRTFHPELQVLDANSARAMGAGEIIDATTNNLRQHRSDLLRFWLLSKFGGAWFDSDCILLAPSLLLNDARRPNKIGAFCRRKPNGARAEGFHFVMRKSPMADKAFAECKAVLSRGVFHYADPSCGVVGRAYQGFRKQCVMREHNSYYPMTGKDDFVLVHQFGKNKNKHAILRNRPVMLHVGSHATAMLSALSREQLLNGNWVISELLRSAIPGYMR